MTNYKTYERNMRIYKMVKSGERTQSEMANEYKISPQRVTQIIGAIEAQKTMPRASSRRVVYPAIRKWMDENHITQVKFNELVNDGAGGSFDTPLRRFLLGGDRVSIELIKKILEVMGMTFEEAFEREEK